MGGSRGEGETSIVDNVNNFINLIDAHCFIHSSITVPELDSCLRGGEAGIIYLCVVH